jgi:hypothetical protein
VLPPDPPDEVLPPEPPLPEPPPVPPDMSVVVRPVVLPVVVPSEEQPIAATARRKRHLRMVFLVEIIDEQFI